MFCAVLVGRQYIEFRELEKAKCLASFGLKATHKILKIQKNTIVIFVDLRWYIWKQQKSK